MRILTLFASAFFVLSLFIACSSPAEGVSVLNCKDFDEKINKTDNPQLIDVRTPGEYSKGTVYDALNIDYYADNFKSDMDKLDKTLPVFVFCAKGGRSASAASVCKELGFKEIYDLEGGYNAWSSYQSK
jgi:rhodanese-related sulfurtransferase